jgi:hypothetical protein
MSDRGVVGGDVRAKDELVAGKLCDEVPHRLLASAPTFQMVAALGDRQHLPEPKRETLQDERVTSGPDVDLFAAPECGAR